MKKSLIIFSCLFAWCGLLPLTLTSCSSANSVPMNPVHEFINERTFTLTATTTMKNSEQQLVNNYCTGTSWLFYHDTSSSTDNYTYYALTNFHVIEGILSFINSAHYSPVIIGVGFEDFDDANSNIPIDLTKLSSTSLETGKANSLGMIPLETLPISSTSTPNMFLFDEGWEYYWEWVGDFPFDFGLASFFMDMSVVEYDFGDVVKKYPDSDLKKRLDELNSYADNHNNYVTPVATAQDYKDAKKYSYILSDMYASGFPAARVNGDFIYPNKNFATSLKSQNLNRGYISLYREPKNVYFNDIYKYVFYDDKTYEPVKVNSIGRKDFYAFTISNDYYYRNSNTNLEFGGGASGSMGVFATDINDPDTYKACGIYWGTTGNNLCFSPFLFNWGNTMILPNGSSYNATTTFIDDFFTYYKDSPTEHVFNV